MNNVAHLPGASAPLQNPQMLALIRRTVAADTNDDEFSLFIHMARALGLDPLRRQIYAFVFSKNDPKKRRMSIITAIDGFRTIADRTGNYRPDEDEPTFETDPSLVSASNPAGLVKAVVRIYKFSHNAWHKVTAAALWSEYAPLKEEWSEYRSIEDGKWPDGNTRYKKVPAEGATKIIKLDDSGNWAKMPYHMLAKVAEALALRKAWPDDFANVYVSEEVDRAAMLDITPAEAAQQGAQAERLARVGGKNTVLIDWMAGEFSPLEPTPVGNVADRVMAFLREHKEEPSVIRLWKERNKFGLREFWALCPTDALEIKKEFEKLEKADSE